MAVPINKQIADAFLRDMPPETFFKPRPKTVLESITIPLAEPRYKRVPFPWGNGLRR